MRRTTRIFFAACLWLVLAATQLAHASERWRLAGREGGCYEITTLKRKLPDMPDVRDPQAFLRFLEGKRLQFTSKAHAVPTGQMLEVQIPEAGLSLMFVTQQLCRDRPS